MSFCDDEELDLAISLGRHFAGVVFFEDLLEALKSGRFDILSCHRLKDNTGRYEVVLRAIA